jgi:chloramphenicol-sensitive protein RarD
VSAPDQTIRGGVGRGVLLAILAYAIWGFLPLFFLLLVPATAIEIVSWRILFSIVFCAILLTVTHGWKHLFELFRDRRIALTLLVAGILILINWLVYVYATTSGEVVQAALGYFANPILTVLLGVFFLRERLRPMQWVAIGISVIAVLVIAINYGAFPWIAVVLALSFGTYGLIKRRVGGRVDALSGLTIETMWLAPIAVAQLLFVGFTSGLTIGHVSVLQTVAMALAGVVTAVPLLLFAGAARRVPLTVIGLTQYLTPVLQFLIGVLLLHEAMPIARLIGFVFVWIALIILSIDTFRASRASRRRARESLHPPVLGDGTAVATEATT